jgi:hypothetical protein
VLFRCDYRYGYGLDADVCSILWCQGSFVHTMRIFAREKSDFRERDQRLQRNGLLTAQVETSGLWKNAWANRTIPLDMQVLQRHGRIVRPRAGLRGRLCCQCKGIGNVFAVCGRASMQKCLNMRAGVWIKTETILLRIQSSDHPRAMAPLGVRGRPGAPPPPARAAKAAALSTRAG